MASWTAGQLIDRLRADWLGPGKLEWGPVELTDIRLTSERDAWPPVVALDFTFEGRPERWENEWPHLEPFDLEGASSLWVGIVGAHMCEAGYQ